MPDQLTRRDLLRYGAASTVAVAVAGCSASSGGQGEETGTESTTTTSVESTNGSRNTSSGQEAAQEDIHPVYGFTASSSDIEAPVQPDHEVQLLIGRRDGDRHPRWASESVDEFYFEPTGLRIEPGDTVKFNSATAHHNVVPYHPAYDYSSRVPEGVPPFASPILPSGGYWLYTFDTGGVYDLNCSPHEYFGMVMRLVVGEATGPAAKPLPDLGTEAAEVSDLESGGKEPRLPSGTAYTVLRDPALDPEHIVEQGTISWEDLASESKRLFPTVVGPPQQESVNRSTASNGSSTSNTNISETNEQSLLSDQ